MNVVARVFDFFFDRWMATRLRIRVAGVQQGIPDGVPIVYCANHQSWWDGFLLRSLHRHLRPGAPFRAVMLERELRRHPMLGLLGAIGITPGSFRSGRHLLRELSGLPRAAGVAFFPQGRIHPLTAAMPRFETGVGNVARVLAPAVVLPVALRIVPGRDHRMDALVSVGAPVTVSPRERLAVESLEGAVFSELAAISTFVGRFAEDAADQWPTSATLPPVGLPPSWNEPSLLLPISRN
jgi:1-acyl-sn-glycerol-3-phosphate acyltransferase